MKKISRGNKIVIISATCLILLVIAILIASEFSIYRADTINPKDISEYYITFMPFSNYKSNVGGIEIKGKYKQKIKANGDYNVIFYDKSGEIAFIALRYGDTIQIENMRFNRKF